METNQWVELFLEQEEASRNVIVIKRAYIEMLEGDHSAAVLLSQIIYWHMPSKAGTSKLRVEMDGHHWIARGIGEWYDETGLTYKQARRCLEVLEEKELVVRKNGMFGGKKTNFVRINWPVFMPSYVKACSICPNGQNRFAQMGKTDLPSRVESITEITTETTTQEAAPFSARPPAPRNSYVGIPEQGGIRYVEAGNEFEDEERGRPKWAIPEEHPVLKRMLDATGRQYFHSQNERAMWKIIRQGLQAGTIPQEWVDHCIGFAAKKEGKMRLTNLLKYATNFEKMKDWGAGTTSEKKFEFDPNERADGPGVYL